MAEKERTTIDEHIAYSQGRVDQQREDAERREGVNRSVSENVGSVLSESYLQRVRRVVVGLGIFSLANGVVSGVSIASERLLDPEVAVASVGCNIVLLASVGIALKESFRSSAVLEESNPAS